MIWNKEIAGRGPAAEEVDLARAFVRANFSYIKKELGIKSILFYEDRAAQDVFKWIQNNIDMIKNKFKNAEDFLASKSVRSQIVDGLKGKGSYYEIKRSAKSNVVNLNAFEKAIKSLKVGESLKLPYGITVVKTKSKE